MVIRRFISFAVLLCVSCLMWAQLTVEECYDRARNNYPLIRQYALIERSREFNLANAAKAWLPQIQFSAKATYQSDVTKLPIDFNALGLSGVHIPTLSRDQYAAVVDIQQTLWEGGAISARKAAVKSQSEIAQAEVEVGLYALRDKVNGLFFGILLCDELLKQNEIMQSELATVAQTVTNLINGGMASATDLDIVKIEQTACTARSTQISSNRTAYAQMLGYFLGLSADSIILSPPTTPEWKLSGATRPRPELLLFVSRENGLEAERRAIKADIMPRFGLFVTGGYGKPGLNMLQDEFKPYYIGGVRMTWNISNLYTRSNRLHQLDVDRLSIASQRETFLFNNSLENSQNSVEIEKIGKLLQLDDEIIRLRTSVRAATEAALKNGTKNTDDLIRDTNSLEAARRDRIIHEIELLQANYKLKYTNGN